MHRSFIGLDRMASMMDSRVPSGKAIGLILPYNVELLAEDKYLHHHGGGRI